MIKRTFYALTLLLILCVSGIQAQNTKFSKEEFRNRQKEFFTRQAGLSNDEAQKFFPLYFELQDKKQAYNKEAWQKLRQGKNPNTHGNGIWENCGRCDSGTHCSRRTGTGICAEIQTIPSGQENLPVAKSGNALPQRTAKRFQTRSERSGKEKIRDTDRFFLPKIWKTKIFAYLCTAFEKQATLKKSFGEVAEWSIAAVLKTVVLRGTRGSNPCLSAET